MEGAYNELGGEALQMGRDKVVRFFPLLSGNQFIVIQITLIASFLVAYHLL